MPQDKQVEDVPKLKLITKEMSTNKISSYRNPTHIYCYKHLSGNIQDLTKPSFCSYMKPCACGHVISETSNLNTNNNKQVSATICFTLNPSMLASVQCTDL